MSAGPVIAIIVAIAASAVRMMRFRKRWLAKINNKKYQLSAPKVMHDPTRQRFPIPVRAVLRIVRADEYMELAAR